MLQRARVQYQAGKLRADAAVGGSRGNSRLHLHPRRHLQRSGHALRASGHHHRSALTTLACGDRISRSARRIAESKPVAGKIGGRSTCFDARPSSPELRLACTGAHSCGESLDSVYTGVPTRADTSEKGFGLLREGIQKWVYWWASNYASPGLTVLGRRSPGLPAPAQAGTRGAISVNSCGVLCKRGTTRARSPCRSLSSDSLLARARRDTPRISRASARAHSYTQWSVHAVPDSIFVLNNESGSRRPE